MNKEPLIKDVNEQLGKHQTYIFKDLLQKLIDAGFNEDHQLVKILNILISQTYQTLTEKKIKLDQKYIKKLRVLSILSCFYGQERFSLSQLQKELICSKQECLNLLMEASISKLVVVKIDELRGIISIERCKVRQRETGKDIDRVINSKIIQIKQKNANIELNLKQTLNSIGKTSQPEQKQEEFFTFSYKDKKRMIDSQF